MTISGLSQRILYSLSQRIYSYNKTTYIADKLWRNIPKTIVQ